MEYSIGDFSKLTGLGIHTLRYYEYEGLITPERNSSNRRCYSGQQPRSKLTGHQTCSAASCGVLTLAAVAEWTCKHVRSARCPRE